ncbi:MAG: hypothetical protein V7603_3148 [Micromonosporaceae bacterium]|jgi:hypothetical protein
MPRPGVRLLGVTLGVVLAVGATVVVFSLLHARARAAAAPAAAVPANWRRPPVDADGLVRRSGVKLVRVALSGAGGLVDLRYQVVDPGLAASLHGTGTPPALVDERSGLVLSRLLMDHAHSGQFKLAETYYLVFENPGSWVHRGSRVTVLLGDAQVEHVPVV